MSTAAAEKQPTPSANGFCPLSEEGSLIKLAAAADVKAGTPRRFSMLAYSGAPVQRWYGQLVFDLRGIKFNAKRTPILKNHDEDQIAGMSDSVRVTAEGLQIDGFLLSKSEAAQEIVAFADEGYDWQSSVGMEMKSLEDLKAGATAEVNGRTINGPAYIVRQSVLRESSFVPVGADGDTSGDVLAFFNLKKKEDVMPDKKEETVDLAAEQKKGQDAERKRCADLKAAFPKDPAFALSAIEAGQSVLEAKAAYADKLAADNAELLKKNEELSKKPEGGAKGADPLTFGGGKKEGGEGKDFMTLASERQAAAKCSAEESLRWAALNHPKEHADYVAASRAAKPREIERPKSK